MYFSVIGVLPANQDYHEFILIISWQHFCMYFSVIGVLPANQDSHEFVMSQRKEQYENLRHALYVMRKVDKDTPIPIVFLKMFLIEEGRLPFDEVNMVMN